MSETKALTAAEGAALMGPPQAPRPTRPAVANPIETADAIDKAADYIEQAGWIRGSWWADTDNIHACPVCISGALRAVLWGSPGATAAPDDQAGKLHASAWSALSRYFHTSPVTWNDVPGRTKEQVTEAMRGAAAGLRKQVVA